MILSNPRKKVLYVSRCWVGKAHDYGMFKEEFPPDQDWLKNFCVRVDLGFLGIEKDYEVISKVEKTANLGVKSEIPS